MATERAEWGIREGDRQSGVLLSLQGRRGFRRLRGKVAARLVSSRELRRSSTASRRATAASSKVRATVKEFGELGVGAPSGDLARQAPWTICARLFAAVRRVASRTLVLNRAERPRGAA
jgi:hypothetical protein